ncbi:hypothetical protein PFISCL1PPCAC_8896, partial [Pristionchus fissidentatus]
LKSFLRFYPFHHAEMDSLEECYINKLPDELLSHIVVNMHIKERSKFGRACKRIRNIDRVTGGRRFLEVDVAVDENCRYYFHKANIGRLNIIVDSTSQFDLSLSKMFASAQYDEFSLRAHPSNYNVSCLFPLFQRRNLRLLRFDVGSVKHEAALIPGFANLATIQSFLFQQSFTRNDVDILPHVVARSRGTRIDASTCDPRSLIDAFQLVCESPKGEEKFVFVSARLSLLGNLEQIFARDVTIHLNQNGWFVHLPTRSVMIIPAQTRYPQNFRHVIMGKVNDEGRIIDETMIQKLELKTA